MQAPNTKDKPLSWTEALWDSLQFHSKENKVFVRVKKLTKSVAANFPRLGVRTGHSLRPFQAQRNAQGGQEHEDGGDHSEHRRRLSLLHGLAMIRGFAAPRTDSSHLMLGNSRVAAVSKRSGKHPGNGEYVLLGTDKNQPRQVFHLQTANRQLEKLNAQTLTDLQNLSLIEEEARDKANTKVIEEVHALIGDVVESAEAILSNLGDESVSAKQGIVRKRTASRSTEEIKRNTLVDYLGQRLSDLRQTVSEHFLQAIMLLAGSLHESSQTTESVQGSLQSLAFDCMYLQDRLINAEQNMVSRIHGWTLALKTTDQEVRRTDNALKLMEAACSNAIELQYRVLQTCSVQDCDNEALLEETEHLDLQVQLPWTWLQELQKSIALLYPEKERCLYDCFMDTLLIALEGLESHMNKTHEKDQRSVEDVLFGDVLSCEKRAIASLTRIYSIFNEAVSGIAKNPALEITDFVQIQDFCDHFVNLLTVLCSQLTSIAVSTEAEHQTLTKYRQNHETKVLSLAEDYLRSNLCNIHKDTRASKAVTTLVEKLTQNVKNSEMMVLSHEDALVQGGHSPSSSQAAFNEQTNIMKVSHMSSDVSNPVDALSQCPVDLARNVRIKTPFAIPDNLPEVSESLGDLSGNTDEEQPMHPSDCLLVSEGDTLLVCDASLDLSLGSLPDSVFVARVGIDNVTELKRLGQGSSGYVTLSKLGTHLVVVKELKCQDPIKRQKRFNREAKMHEKLNSCTNIVRFLGRLVKPNESGEDQIVGIITEWCELGDLCTAIQQAVEIQDKDRGGEDISGMKGTVGYRLYKDWNKRLELVVDIASAMSYMHNCDVVHRDLTCKNVLLYIIGGSGDFGAKVCDFERARYLPGGQPIQRTKALANSPPWMGPEVLRNEYYGLKADVYSIGTILWSLMYLQNPWTHLKECTGALPTVIQHLLTAGRISLSISEEDAPKDIRVFPQLVALVKSAWQADPDNRPTMTEFLCRLKQIIC